MNGVKNRCTSPTNVSAFYAFPDIALVDSQNNEADICIEYPSVICLSMTTLPRPPCRAGRDEQGKRTTAGVCTADIHAVSVVVRTDVLPFQVVPSLGGGGKERQAARVEFGSAGSS